jgi:hypothetical protein
MAGKYYSLSGYCYAANNPVLFLDKTGKYIIVNGLDDNVLGDMHKILGTYFGPGTVTLTGGNGTRLGITLNGNLNQDQKKVYDELASMITDQNRGIEISVVGGGTSYNRAVVNMQEMLDDERARGSGSNSPMGSLYHEITEQWYKQVTLGLPARNKETISGTDQGQDDGYKESHAYATRKEADVLGMFRHGVITETTDGSGAAFVHHHYFDKQGKYLYSVRAKYGFNGKIEDNSVTKYTLLNQKAIGKVTSELNELLGN